VTHTTPDSPALGRSVPVVAVRRLASELDGTAMSRDDPGHREASTGFNLATHRDPDVVVLAESPADVVAAVRFAIEQELPVAVMGTGHHGVRPFGHGLLVNTSLMNAVQIDTAARRALVGAGARWRDVVPVAAEHRLMPVHGSSGSVGVVGFTLGGGLSPTLGRKYGWGTDHIIALEAVTADGALVRASATENSELFWALRGGRSAIGIVTAMEIDLVPVGEFVGGGLFFDGHDAEPVLAAFERATAAAPNELTLSIAFLRLPPLPGIPDLLAGKFVVHVRVAAIDLAVDLDRLLAPIREAAPLLVDTVQELSAEQFELVHNDPTDPAPFSEQTSMLPELTRKAQQALLEKVGPTSDTGLHIVALRHLGGALARTSPTGRSVITGDARYVLWAISIGMPDDNAAGVAETKSLISAMSEWSTGIRYLNYSPEDGHPEAAFSSEDWARLQRIKSEVDPLGRFSSERQTKKP
jgi:FAD/FMN-containing dehydrogenase